MEKEKLQSVIYAKIDELPTLSAVIPRILSLMDDPSADAHKITEAISHNPALTSRILIKGSQFRLLWVPSKDHQS